jgi:predicted CopG family antitoxin
MVAGPNPAEGSKTSHHYIASSQKCIYMHMHIIFAMTKVISLSEKAYETLKNMKKSGESFSDVVIRVASKEKKKSILEFAGTWKGADADEVLAQIMKDRDHVKPRELEI